MKGFKKTPVPVPVVPLRPVLCEHCKQIGCHLKSYLIQFGWSTSPFEYKTGKQMAKFCLLFANKFSSRAWIVCRYKQWLWRASRYRVTTVLPQLLSKLLEVLQWVGTVASAEKENVNILLSFWNMKKEHWCYRVDTTIFCKRLNVWNAKIWLFLYN